MVIERKKIIGFFLFVFVLAIYFFIPNIILSGFQNSPVTSKSISFFLLVEIAFLIFFLKKSFSYGATSISIIDILFILLIVYISINRYLLQGNYKFSIRYSELVGLVALYCILRSLNNRQAFYSLGIVIVFGANVEIIIGYLQLYGVLSSTNHYFKSTGSFFNSAPFAGYLIAVFPISLFLLKSKLFSKTKVEGGSKRLLNNIIKYGLIFNILGSLSLLPVLGSRASYLSLIFIIVFIYRHDIKSFVNRIFVKRVWRFACLMVLILAVVSCAYWFWSVKRQSTSGRYLVLKVATGMLKDKPLVGFGFDNFRSNYMIYQKKYFETHIDSEEIMLADNTIYAFNEPLQYLIEEGVVGGILLLVLVTCLFRFVDKKHEFWILGLPGLLGIFVFSFFSYPSDILPIKIILLFYFSYSTSACKGIFEMSAHSIKVRSKISYGTVAFLSFLSVVILFYFSFRYTARLSKGYKKWQTALDEYNMDRFDKSLFTFEQIFETFKRNGDYLTDYGKALFFAKEFNAGAKVLITAKSYASNTIVEQALGDCQKEIKDYKNAEISYLNALEMRPNSFYARFLLLNLYRESRQPLKAIKIARSIVKLPVKVESEAVDTIVKEAKIYLKSTSSYSGQ